MRPPVRLVHGALLAALALPGCSREPAGDFTATLAGPMEGRMAGNAVFCRGGTGGFVLALHDPKSSAGFLLGRSATPAPGPYAVVDTSGPVEDRFWFSTRFDKLPGGTEYRYRTDEGNVRIVSSDSAWIRGRFEVDLVASDASLQVDSKTGMVRKLPTERQRVTGSFTAARAGSCDGVPGAK